MSGPQTMNHGSTTGRDIVAKPIASMDVAVGLAVKTWLNMGLMFILMRWAFCIVPSSVLFLSALSVTTPTRRKHFQCQWII